MISLPTLPYAYNALEPSIDAATMELHHTKHHQGYIDKLNSVLTKYPQYQNADISDLLRTLSTLKMEEKDKMVIINHGGGHVNHSFFWNIMNPKNETDVQLVRNIESKFGSVQEFKKSFSETAMNHFGSGWAWLAKDTENQLKLYSTPNQESPYLLGHSPVIGLDLWEHAYYLKYQNRKAEYIQNWWNVLKLIP